MKSWAPRFQGPLKCIVPLFPWHFTAIPCPLWMSPLPQCGVTETGKHWWRAVPNRWLSAWSVVAAEMSGSPGSLRSAVFWRHSCSLKRLDSDYLNVQFRWILSVWLYNCPSATSTATHRPFSIIQCPSQELRWADGFPCAQSLPSFECSPSNPSVSHATSQHTCLPQALRGSIVGSIQDWKMS